MRLIPSPMIAALAMSASEALGQGAAPPGPNNLLLTCTGAFAPDSNVERLREVFGASHVRGEAILVEPDDAHSTPGAIVYPDDPERRIIVLWSGERHASDRPGQVYVHASRRNSSLWRGPAGLRLGATIEEVEAANGGPFLLSGLSVIRWNGALARVAGDENCRLLARFVEAENVPPSELPSGHTSSANPVFRALRPRLSFLGVLYAPRYDHAPPLPADGLPCVTGEY